MNLVIGLLGRVPLPLPLPLELHADLDVRVLAYSTLLTLVTTVLCALAPAVQATRRSQLPALKNQDPLAVRRVGRRWSLRNLLVVGQVAVALVLLVTALLFVRNLARAEDLDPGFDVEHVLLAQIGIVEGRFTPVTGTAWLDGAVERLRGMPGVEGASYAHGAPLTLRSGMTSGARLVANGRQPGFQAMYQDSFVGPDYFKVMGIGIVKGREFRQDDRRGGPVVVAVNEEFVRRYLSDVGADRRATAVAGTDRGRVPRRRRGRGPQRQVSFARRITAGGHLRSVRSARQPAPLCAHLRALAPWRRTAGARDRARAAGARSVCGDRGAADARVRSPLRSCPAASVQACSAPWARSA